MSQYHTPVMLDESVSALVTNPDGVYADVTFGGGGHTAELLSRLHDGARVIAFDRDGDALGNAPEDTRLTLVHNNFRFIENYARHFGVRFDGILADLGVVFDEAEVVVYQRQTLVFRRIPQGIPVTIEGDDARAIV